MLSGGGWGGVWLVLFENVFWGVFLVRWVGRREGEQGRGERGEGREGKGRID